MVSELEIKCWTYCNLVEDTKEFAGKGFYTINKLRSELHDEICNISNISKEEIYHITNNLDKIKYNGTKLYLEILSIKNNRGNK